MRWMEWEERDFLGGLIVIQARDNKAPMEGRGPSAGEEATVWKTILNGKISDFNGWLPLLHKLGMRGVSGGDSFPV